MNKTLTAIALVASLALAGAAHADTNWTVSDKTGNCVLSSGGAIPDLDHTPIFVNFEAMGYRTLVTLGGSVVGGAEGSNLEVALVTPDSPATSGLYRPQWDINGPEPFVLLHPELLSHADHAKTLFVLIQVKGQFPISLAGFEVAHAQFEDCKIRHGQ